MNFKVYSTAEDRMKIIIFLKGPLEPLETDWRSNTCVIGVLEAEVKESRAEKVSKK